MKFDTVESQHPECSFDIDGKPGEHPFGNPAPDRSGVVNNPTIIVCPETGESIAEDDIDGLINLVVRMKRIKANVEEADFRARQALAKLAPEATTKTRRVQGRHAVAVLEFPSTAFNQSMLKEIWNSYPNLRDQVLRLESIGVKRTEWKKLQATTGHPDLEQVKKMLAAAEFETHRPPSVKVEDLV